MKRRLVPAFVLILLALMLPASAHAGFDTAPDPAIENGSAARDLDAARERWAANGPAAYLFRIEAHCFCPGTGPVDVMVRNGASTVSDPDWWGPRSIPEVFEEVETAIEKRVSMLRVKYRDGDGLPESLYVDWIAEAVDDEMGYEISSLVPLNGGPVVPTPPDSTAAGNRKQAVKIARQRIRESSKGRSWKRGRKRSIVCRPRSEAFLCTAKWTLRGKRHSERVLVLRRKV